MDGNDIRRRRKALGMTLKEFGAAVGLTGDFIGRVERGEAPITPRTAAAIRSIKPKSPERRPSLRDPLERQIEAALVEAGIDFVTDEGGGTQSRLDFYLPQLDVSIEVKRFFTARTGEQIARAANVIVAQGELAVRFLAQAIRSGDFIEMIAGGVAAGDNDDR